MCGIIASFNKNDKVNHFILDQYQRQISRGTNGFGAVFINDDMSFSVKRAVEPIKALIDVNLTESKMIIFHHRIPTSTENKLEQTHPLSVKNKDLEYDYLVIHNGVIRNDNELKALHEELGFKYKTEEKGAYIDAKFNDSEALAIEVARYIDGKSKEISISGSAAFVCLKIDKKTKKVTDAYYGTNGGSPLNAHTAPGNVMISSEGPGAKVEKEMLFKVSLKTLKVTSEKLNIKDPEEKKKAEFGFQSRVRYTPYQAELKKIKEEEEEKKIGSKDSVEASDYADILEKGYESINKTIEAFADYINDTSYSNDEEVSDAIRDISKVLYEMEARAKIRKEDLEAMESIQEESTWVNDPRQVALTAR